ncbi:MAG: selenocysteine-specific translation elongation factor [Armatimonadota bacterium]
MLVESGHTIVGTAGHIDHGKTALIKALTGFDTDTLEEEKRRGITIELGFAFLDTGIGREIVFIDVPGHEKLVRTMVAGASNLDAVLLVVAADEGIGVQTIEHFDILRLLDIPDGIVAVTKTDLVDAERIRTVVREIGDLVAGTFLESAPVIPVSSVTEAGVEDVRAALVEVARRTRKRRDTGVFRMPVDRAFAMQGFGAVIAGTILSGRVRVGDRVEIQPDGLTARVRGIQVHGRSVDESRIGVRTAINLQDVKKEQLRRGQTAAACGSVSPTRRVDVQFHLLRTCGEALRNGTRVRFHVGTDEVIARVRLLDRESMAPGQTAITQFVLESPTVAVPKDRFVIRTFTSETTIGGGLILDADPPRHKRFDERTMAALEKLTGGLDEAVEQAFEKSGAATMGVSDAAGAVGESEEAVAEAVQRLVESGRLVQIALRESGDVRRGSFMSSSACEELANKLVGILEDYYARNPYRVFMPASDLQSRFVKLADRQVYDALIANLCDSGRLRASRTKVGLAGREPQWKPGERELAARIESIYESTGYSTPPEEELQLKLKVERERFDNVMTALTDMGRLVRLADRVVYHEKSLCTAREFVTRCIREKGSISAPELRDLLGVTRKYAIAILEYLDDAQVTRRLGDRRVLR